MMLDSAGKWIIALAFGAVMVWMYSWSRFDEPSCDSQPEYFSRYKPRFFTSYARYARAKWAHVGAMIVIYVAFSLVPELFNTITAIAAKGDPSKTIEGLPLAAALALVVLQNVQGLKELERRIRGSLHSVARIPDCVRRTVAQMRSSPFTFEHGADQCLTRKLLLQSGTANQLPFYARCRTNGGLSRQTPKRLRESGGGLNRPAICATRRALPSSSRARRREWKSPQTSARSRSR
ncbi:hypothetical protein JQ596_18630 [Bradyrhizobium manausense]|uniref:hypothetical protein n=1 Tax=Bradyrhizobium TaxID=374 RepID=UPI001BADAE00|nr:MULTISPECIES: hypothetical protein [Bradyrhizobium]MBR0827545.1 hypothetical protein [Bradyrhizobium manausense]UVO26031.1 hypothetical protein KUF59_26090 [Bradyrhizobium arachidis]